MRKWIKKHEVVVNLKCLDRMPIHAQMEFIRQLICANYSVAFHPYVAAWCVRNAELIAATLKSEMR